MTKAVRLRPVIRLFVSSTFSDMRHERNALQERVFPNLERICEQSGFQFQAIDLRWGVPTEAWLDHRTMRICFEELRRAQEISPKPNFLILLGDRYGWRPLPEEISVEEFEELESAAVEVERGTGIPAHRILKDWYRRDENALPPVYILQSRNQHLTDSKDFVDQRNWDEVQQVLWDIVNSAVPPALLASRFELVAGTASPPQAVRFQASATEQEIWHGALCVTDAHEHVLGLFRAISNFDAFTDKLQIRDFVDLDASGGIDEVLQLEQMRLKGELRGRLGVHNVFEYRAALGENSSRLLDVTTDHLAQLCSDVERLLTEVVSRQIAQYWSWTTEGSEERSARELEVERNEHVRFGLVRGGKGTFVGRTSELQTILDYVHGDSPCPLLIHGTSGCGKSALMARASQELAISFQPIVRFIGITPNSSDARSLLSTVCMELRLRNPLNAKLPVDLAGLERELMEHLQTATAVQPIVLILDALDQLSEIDDGPLLRWLPPEPLPDHVKLILSFQTDSPNVSSGTHLICDRALWKYPNAHRVDITSLSFSDAQLLFFDRWLPEAQRRITLTQRELVETRLITEACRQPIYLRLLFGEASRWKSYDAIPTLGKGPTELVGNFFDRLAKEHGSYLVSRLLTSLAVSRWGLSEIEILELLYADHDFRRVLEQQSEVLGHSLPREGRRIPDAIWSRIRLDLDPYIAERAAPGSYVIGFYHRQLLQMVVERFLLNEQAVTDVHGLLADYFSWRAHRGPLLEVSRPYFEMVYHLWNARRMDMLHETLTFGYRSWRVKSI